MSSDSLGRLRSWRVEEKVMNNRKGRKSRPSPELANEIDSRTLGKNRWAEQMKYLARLKAKLLEFAKGMCATRGRGAVGVGWPWPASLDVIPPKVFYLTESFLRSQGMTPDHTPLQAIARPAARARGCLRKCRNEHSFHTLPPVPPRILEDQLRLSATLPGFAPGNLDECKGR
jgi:hypothetical protein